jgi:cytochrome bd ubiquinol oxidase subunit I
MVAGFAIAGVYAVGLLRGRRDRLHRLGLVIPLTVAAIATPLQIFVGDIAAREVFENEPAKFAAIEALPQTSARVPEVLGGVLVDGEMRYGLEIPLGASLLAGLDPDTEIRGLDAVPPEFRQADRLVNVVHLAFQVMVGIGSALLALSAWFAWLWWRHRGQPHAVPDNRWFLRCVAVSGVLAIIALEAGWVVTELGRQPWTVVGHLLTRDAVTTTGNIWPFFAATLALYAALATGTFFVLRLLRRRWREVGEHTGLNGVRDEADVPYGPSRRTDAPA